jgi:hypothetical protein
MMAMGPDGAEGKDSGWTWNLRAARRVCMGVGHPDERMRVDAQRLGALDNAIQGLGRQAGVARQNPA